jgi:hypothetical protein
LLYKHRLQAFSSYWMVITHRTTNYMLQYMWAWAQIELQNFHEEISKAHSYVQKGKVRTFSSHLACGSGVSYT